MTLHAGSPEVQSLSDRAAARQAARELVTRARRSVDILSWRLDPRVYDDEEFCAAVRAFLLGSHRARLRVLVREALPIVTRGHRLLDLIQRLSSQAEIRVLAPEHQDTAEVWLVSDVQGYLHRQTEDRFEATTGAADSARARRLSRRFDDLWGRAQANLNFKRLHL